MQAWKIVSPTSKATRSRARDGYEWIYVLSGRMRFVLGGAPALHLAGDRST